MNIRKRVFLAALAFMLVLSGCKKAEEQESSVIESSESSAEEIVEAVEEEPLKLGIIQYRDEPSFNYMREAFMARIEEWGYDESMVSIEYKNADGNNEAYHTMTDEFVSGGYDLIVAVASPDLNQTTEKVTGADTRIMFLSETGADNAVGVITPSNAAAVMEVAAQVKPGFGTLGLLYNSSTASMQEVDALKAYCAEQGIALQEQFVTSEEEARLQMEALCPSVGAVYIPFDYTMTAVMEDIIAVSGETGTPIFSSESIWAEKGGLASVGFDYDRAGKDAADMAVALMEGRPVSEVQTKTEPDTITYINHGTMESMERGFPEEVMKKARVFN